MSWSSEPRSNNHQPPFSREFRGATSDKCHAPRFFHEEKLRGIEEKLRGIVEKPRGIVEKPFGIDAARFFHEEKLSGIAEKLSGIAAALFLLDTKLPGIDAAFLSSSAPRLRPDLFQFFLRLERGNAGEENPEIG